MPSITLFAAATAAATKSEFNTFGMEWAQINAAGLAGAERIDLFKGVNGTWVAVNDRTGTAQQLAPSGTSPGPMCKLEGGAIYSFDKPITAGACSVSLDIGPAINP